MIWQDFVDYFRKNFKFPVIVTILKKTKLVEEDDEKCVIECENIGTRTYLESKRVQIEEALLQYTGKPKRIVILVGTSKKKRLEEEKPLPLVEYQHRTEQSLRESGLIPHFTFECFAVSTSNNIAHAAARAVSENPSKIYNPFFVYGDVGVGKTHLCQAIANSILKKNPHKRILYCTSEEFTNDLVESIRQKNTKKTRNKYRSLDVLIVDDIQFIAGKTYVQEEFYHTFNTIVLAGGQIILSSDRPPKEIKELEDRLKSRFSGGLIIDMQKPDFELRTAILLIKAHERNITIDMDAAQSLAERIRDTRELEGALLKMLSFAIADNQNHISVESTLKALSQHQEQRVNRIDPHDVIRVVSSFYNLRAADIRGSSRKEGVVRARQVVMYLLRTLLNMKHNEIAFLLKRKDHTTVMHGVNKITGLVMKEVGFKEEVASISDQLV